MICAYCVSHMYASYMVKKTHKHTSRRRGTAWSERERERERERAPIISYYIYIYIYIFSRLCQVGTAGVELERGRCLRAGEEGQQLDCAGAYIYIYIYRRLYIYIYI